MLPREGLYMPRNPSWAGTIFWGGRGVADIASLIDRTDRHRKERDMIVFGSPRHTEIVYRKQTLAMKLDKAVAAALVVESLRLESCRGAR